MHIRIQQLMESRNSPKWHQHRMVVSKIRVLLSLMALLISSLIFYWMPFLFVSGFPSGLSSPSRARQELKLQKIVFAAIVRDNIRHLPGLVERLVALGEPFKEFAFVFSENDSSDGTKEYLDQLHHNATSFSVTRVGQDFLVDKRPSISFLARMRNFYLHEIYTQPLYADYNYVLVFDADFQKDMFVTREGLFDCFNRPENWAVMAANGERWGKMYDAFAFRNEEFDLPYKPEIFPEGINTYWPTILHIQAKYEDGPLVPVKSAFGGLAIYQKSLMQGLFHNISSEDCEHVSLHEQIRARGGHIYMNPNMRLTYPD